MVYLTVIVTILGSLVGIWAVFRYILLIEVRINENTFKTIYDLMKDERKIIIDEELITESKWPLVYQVIFYPKHLPIFYLYKSERLMQAGWDGKESVSIVTCFRWHYPKIKYYLTKQIKKLQREIYGVSAEVITPYYTDKIGSIKYYHEPVLHTELYSDFEQEVAEVAEGRRSKTSALLYGKPGNGKTSLIKYLASKYGLPIKIVTFSPEWTNYHIMLMFAQITSKCIVLFEDFDNYFNGRQCLIGANAAGGSNMGIKFTFDSILNGLDGVYNSYENVIFIMTVNDIEKVDHAIRNRPSRFKYQKKFDNPDLAIRQKLIGHWGDQTENLNLDQIFRLREFKKANLSLQDSLKKLECVSVNELREIAYNRYLERQTNDIQGSEFDDWQYALNTK